MILYLIHLPEYSYQLIFQDMTKAESRGSGISSGKLMSYLARKKNNSRSQADKMRLLCLDALVEEGDKDYDWTLNFSGTMLIVIMSL